MFRGQRRGRAAGSRSKGDRGQVREFAGFRRRKHWWSMTPLRVRPRPILEPVSVAEAEFFRQRGFYVRVTVLGVVVTTLFAILLLRLWSLSVIQGPRFAHAVQAQADRTVYFPLARGGIVDRSGRMLVGTTGRLVVTADAPTLGTIDEHGRWTPSRDGLLRLRRLARLAHVPTWKLIAAVRRGVRRTPFTPAVVLQRPSRDLASYLSERASSWRGVQTAVVPQRWYPAGGFGSEFLGLLGEVSPSQLRARRYAGARPGQIVGQSGVEAGYNRFLDPGLAKATVPVDARGKIVGPLRYLPVRRHARGLQLTIDSRLQRAAERAIRDGIAFAHRAGHPDADAGAAVVMNPWDGSIYALASVPDFDQSRAAHDPGYAAGLLRAPATPLLNRATQGLYPTGSTFKPIVAEAALASGLITPYSILPCTGSLLVGNIVFHNVEPAINANLNLDQALAISCDTWFYRLGTMFYARQAATGALDMQRWAKLLGLGHPTGLDVPGEYGGVVPTPGVAAEDVPRPGREDLVRGSVGQPVHRPGLPGRDPVATRAGLLGPCERRQGRPTACGTRCPFARRRQAVAAVPAAAPSEPRRPRHDPAGLVRRSACGRWDVSVDLRLVPRPGCRQDRHRRDAERHRSFVVCVVGAGA